MCPLPAAPSNPGGLCAPGLPPHSSDSCATRKRIRFELKEAGGLIDTAHVVCWAIPCSPSRGPQAAGSGEARPPHVAPLSPSLRGAPVAGGEGRFQMEMGEHKAIICPTVCFERAQQACERKREGSRARRLAGGRGWAGRGRCRPGMDGDRAGAWCLPGAGAHPGRYPGSASSPRCFLSGSLFLRRRGPARQAGTEALCLLMTCPMGLLEYTQGAQ